MRITSPRQQCRVSCVSFYYLNLDKFIWKYTNVLAELFHLLNLAYTKKVPGNSLPPLAKISKEYKSQQENTRKAKNSLIFVLFYCSNCIIYKRNKSDINGQVSSHGPIIWQFLPKINQQLHRNKLSTESLKNSRTQNIRGIRNLSADLSKLKRKKIYFWMYFY